MILVTIFQVIFQEWYNDYTGEIYDSLPDAIVTVIQDMHYYPACRTLKMLNIRPWED